MVCEGGKWSIVKNSSLLFPKREQICREKLGTENLGFVSYKKGIADHLNSHSL